MWVCSCCSHVPDSSKPGSHSLRLDVYNICFARGGSFLVLPAASPKGPPDSHARASVSTLLLYPLSLVLRCPAARFVQKARPTVFQLVDERRDVDPRTASYFFIFGRQHHRTVSLVVIFYCSSITDWLISYPVHLSPPQISTMRHSLFCIMYLLRVIHFQAKTTGSVQITACHLAPRRP